MQLCWNGVQRRNIPPGTLLGPPDTTRQDPVRSGLPFGMRGVSASAARGSGPPPNCACDVVTINARSAPATAARCVLTTCCLLMKRAPPHERTGAGPRPVETRHSVLRRACRAHAFRYRHDDVYLADLGQGRREIADDLAVAPLDDRAGIQGFDSMQGI